MSPRTQAGELQVVIIGGGAVGSATAHFLKTLAPDCTVTVIERDPSYAQASSALSASSIRQQFSSAINIELSRFGLRFLCEFGQRLAVDGQAPVIDFCEGGYLYLATPAGQAVLRENHGLQRTLGADVALLEPAALRQRFDWLNTDGIALGSLGLSGEGWFDGYTLLQALRRKAISQGARYLAAEAAGLDSHASDGVRRVHAVRLADGQALACTHVVNAAGCWARAVADWVGIELPVVGKARTVFCVRCPTALPGCPLLIDPSGIWLRPEGQSFLIGFTPPAAQDADFAPLEPDHDAFERLIWPTLAERIPAFEALRVQSAWAGYYEMNEFDHNAIVGLHPACDNLYFANGFSGHGLQHSPAAGRGLAELILTGAWRSINLDPLGFSRIIDGRPLVEKNVI